MTEHTCQVVFKEELVAYADGDMSPVDAERIAEHIATCPDCRAFAEALERSLEVTQAIWQTAYARWPDTRSFDNVRTQRWPYGKAIAVAASILLILGAGALWVLLSNPGESTPAIADDAKVAELRREIADSADAARLLAAADLLNKYPEARGSVERRYRYIVEAFPETAAAVQARLKTQQFK